MDLRVMLNDNGPAASTPSKPPQPPTLQPALQHHHQVQQQQMHPQRSLPSTPIQTNIQQPFRDYGQPQPSPSRHVSHDYGAQHMPSSAFASPPPYPSAGPYGAGRPPPPPIQPMPPAELRSPSVSSGPVPSPYRQTPGSSISTAGGYPFPQQQPPTSPVQRHQYPPTSVYPREGYGQPTAVAGMTGPPGGPSYMQGSHVPQTPPVGTPGGPHAYVQRSHSAHSTPTPTSAHSQPAQYGAPFVQGSPVATPHSLPHQDLQRQSSLPPTPGGAVPPLSARPVQVSTGYGQPTSPYSQRLPAPSFQSTPQTSPPPPPPPSLPRHSSVQSSSQYDPHSHESIGRGPPLHSDRDRSLSVSPKTRVPSLPSSSGRPRSSVSDFDSRINPPIHPPPTTMAPIAEKDSSHDRASTPAKRKLAERELQPDELENRDTRPPPLRDTNGGRPALVDAGPVPLNARRAMIAPERKKRKLHQRPPIWAQSQDGRPLQKANHVLFQPIPFSGSVSHQANGRVEPQASRQTSPEEKRSIAAPREHQSAPPPPPQPAPSQADAAAVGSGLAPWERTIVNTCIPDSVAKNLADWLFHFVVNFPDIQEMEERGVKFEIEAKLGKLVEKGSSQRIRLPIETECVLSEGDWIRFQSSMSESEHRSFNEFLNEQVKETHMNRSRIPIEYLHRREIDRFVELPPAIREQFLPKCVTRLGGGKPPRVRVTYEKKTSQVLARIVKARIADASIHFPQLPLDCRISINLEWPWDGPQEVLDKLVNDQGGGGYQRDKDRLCYKHRYFQVDLTQVISHTNDGQTNKEHELEVEIDPVALFDQGRRAGNHQPNQYIELVGGLVDNIRVLAHKAAEFSGGR
ncbi:CYTH-like domain-containing protein [Apiosordaria backusii]|uniref:mRNA-capping enzyme subunit beta n=1 Tax=Apiosordaria backusii TaxID=314023 RepID=A0AA40EF23_9PEZI|nr:CYTH-like domain-containing protein [Apiosordaria backusii]